MIGATKVVLTDQSLKRLENSLQFYVEELKIPKAQVIKITNRLMERIRSLTESLYKDQYKPHLSN